jgi:predicted AlkP superfamily pyrophosphatase or phosphodiesterase
LLVPSETMSSLWRLLSGSRDIVCGGGSWQWWHREKDVPWCRLCHRKRKNW